MEITITRRVGRRDYQFRFTGETLHDVLIKSQHLGFGDVDQCGKCHGDNLVLEAYTTEGDGYEYVKVRCLTCKAQLTMGKTKKEGAYFLRRKENSKEFDWQERPESSTL